MLVDSHGDPLQPQTVGGDEAGKQQAPDDSQPPDAAALVDEIRTQAANFGFAPDVVVEAIADALNIDERAAQDFIKPLEWRDDYIKTLGELSGLNADGSYTNGDDSIDVEEASARIREFAAMPDAPTPPENPTRRYRESPEYKRQQQRQQPWLKSFPHKLTEARRNELSDLAEFSKTATEAVSCAFELFQSVDLFLNDKQKYPGGTSISEICDEVWPEFLPPLVEIAQLDCSQLPFWGELRDARIRLATFNDRMIVWRDSKGRKQTAEHWHGVVWHLAVCVTVMITQRFDAKALLLALRHRFALRELGLDEIRTQLEFELAAVMAARSAGKVPPLTEPPGSATELQVQVDVSSLGSQPSAGSKGDDTGNQPAGTSESEVEGVKGDDAGDSQNAVQFTPQKLAGELECTTTTLGRWAKNAELAVGISRPEKHKPGFVYADKNLQRFLEWITGTDNGVSDKCKSAAKMLLATHFSAEKSTTPDRQTDIEDRQTDIYRQ